MAHYTRLETPAQIRGDLSAVGRSLLMDWLLGGVAKPDWLELGLSTQPINDNTAYTKINEVQAEYAVPEEFPSTVVNSKQTGYKRARYPFGQLSGKAAMDRALQDRMQGTRDWIAGSNGYYYNGREIRFKEIPEDGYWPEVVSWFIAVDSQLFAYGATGDMPAVPGDTIVVPVSGLSFRVPPLWVS